MKLQHGLIYFLITLSVAACSSNPPAVSGSTSATLAKSGVAASDTAHVKIAGEKDWRPQTHQVVKGDTMYSIAFNYGLDYHELAALNGITNPHKIKIGLVLRLFPAATNAAPATNAKPTELEIKDQPKVVKYVYNDAAMAKIDDVQNPDADKKTYQIEGASIEETPLKRKTPVAVASVKIEPPAPLADAPIINTEEDTLQWEMPATGKIIAHFSEADNRKGIDIAGKLGQEIIASAPGKVVYSGSGLRGYGKLIIIKHNKTYLSAYAHNDKVLVKEGQTVKRGEKIAEMGKTDADQVKLHFEVRRLGKPVDPAKYLPKS